MRLHRDYYTTNLQFRRNFLHIIVQFFIFDRTRSLLQQKYLINEIISIISKNSKEKTIEKVIM